MKALCLVRYPQGAPQAGDFELRELPDPVPQAGEVLVAVTHLSIDPVPRLRMQMRPPMGPPMRIDAPVEGRCVGRVVQSRDPAFVPGDMVLGELGWQSRAVLPAAQLQRIEGGRPQDHLNALGATGLAAWFVVESIAPKTGETLLVAPAAGAVGSLVCQIARASVPGLQVVGTALGERQARFLEGLGVEPLVADADWHRPGGIDLFVDGVGGALHDRMLGHLNPRARVLLLGFVSAYGDNSQPSYGNAAAVLMKRARMEGFLLADHMARATEARAAIARMLAEGSLKPAEAVHHGLAAAATAFAGLFADSPPGKQIVELENDR
jgi:NADPH-dependent curcumin reductase CurA